VVRGSIGVKYPRAENHETLEAFGLDHGVVVEDVPKDGPAGKAGVKDGDVILSLNDRPVRDGNDLIARVADLPIGSSALLTVDRNGKRQDYKATIEERASVWREELAEAGAPEPKPEPASTKAPEPKFGITITRVTDTERKELGVMDKIGVRVVGVDPGSFADDIGLTEGDVIVSINRQDVGSPADVLKIQGSLKGGQAVALRVVRAGGARGHKDLQKLWVSGRLPGE
jgi:serine protease Do